MARDSSQSKVNQQPPDLPNAELEVLAFVRKEGSVTTREVSEGLERKMGTSAAQALLLRLEAKGLLAREQIKGTRAYRYIPTPAAEPVQRRLTRRFIDRILGGSPTELIASLFDTRPPTPQEIEMLRQLVQQHEQTQEHDADK